MRRFIIGAIISFTILSAVFGASMTSFRPAEACSIIDRAIDGGSLPSTAAWAEVVFVGVVLSHETPRRTDLPAQYSSARVRVDAVLKGTPPRELEFWGLGDDCVGGARLREGERVILAASVVNPDAERPVWKLALVTGKTLLGEDEAAIVTTQYQHHSMGTPEDAIRLWAAAAGATSGQTAAALAAAGIETKSGNSVYTYVMLGVGLILALSFLAGVMISSHARG